MTRTFRTGALVVVAFSMALALTGCVGGDVASMSSPQPTPSADPSVEPTPTAEPLDALTTVVALVARPEVLELRDADGVIVAALDYLSAPSDAVATLTTVFGGAPVDEDYDGSNHFPPSTAHRWDGFELWEQRYVDRWEGVVDELSLGRPAFMVRFTATSARDVALNTADGRHAGGGWDELLAVQDLRQNPSGCSGPYLDYVEDSRVTPDGAPYVVKVSVEFRPTEDTSTIESIAAPVPVYEDGCA